MKIRFVNREAELRALHSWCSSFRYTPPYIYRPRGLRQDEAPEGVCREIHRVFRE